MLSRRKNRRSARETGAESSTRESVAEGIPGARGGRQRSLSKRSTVCRGGGAEQGRRFQQKQQLPSGWEERYDGCDKYYVDHNTHTTHWDLPRAARESHRAPQGDAAREPPRSCSGSDRRNSRSRSGSMVRAAHHSPSAEPPQFAQQQRGQDTWREQCAAKAQCRREDVRNWHAGPQEQGQGGLHVERTFCVAAR